MDKRLRADAELIEQRSPIPKNRDRFGRAVEHGFSFASPEPAPALDVERLRAEAIKTRDLLANYLWNEDDSGDDNDLVAAYDELRDLLGPSTEEGVGANADRSRRANSAGTIPLAGSAPPSLPGEEKWP